MVPLCKALIVENYGAVPDTDLTTECGSYAVSLKQYDTAKRMGTDENGHTMVGIRFFRMKDGSRIPIIAGQIAGVTRRYTPNPKVSEPEGTYWRRDDQWEGENEFVQIVGGLLVNQRTLVVDTFFREHSHTQCDERGYPYEDVLPELLHYMKIQTPAKRLEIAKAVLDAT